MVQKMNIKLSEWLDDISINRKLTILYIFCVLIPVLIINCMVYTMVSNNAKKERLYDMKNTEQRLEYNLLKIMESAGNVAERFQSDRVLNDFLNTKYESNLDYYEHYFTLMKDNVFSYYYQSESVYKISIFTNNHTVTRSSSFYTMDEAKNEEWYQYMIENQEKDISLFTYYSNPVVDKPFNSKTDRKISLISRLDHYSDIIKFLKVDISYSDIQRLVYNEKSLQDIIITRGDEVLFDTRGDRRVNAPFDKYEPIDKSYLSVEKTVKMINEDWDIRVICKKANIMENFMKNRVLLFGVILITFILPSTAIILIGNSLKKRIHITDSYLNKIKDGKYECIDCYEGKDEIGRMIASYNIMVNRIRELIEVVLKGKAERQKLEIARKDAELKAIQSQVNPHFIFNALESIRMKSLVNGESETAEIIGALAVHMRRKIQWDVDVVTIGDEIEFLKGYLEIQKYRFGDRLKHSLYLQEECKKYEIPRFSILSFVENSCVHGIEKKIEGGNIDIIIMSEEDRLIIEIMDNGYGMEVERLAEVQNMLEHASLEYVSQGKSIGIINTYIRLKMFFEDDVQCQIESKIEEGTDVYLSLPKRY